MKERENSRSIRRPLRTSSARCGVAAACFVTFIYGASIASAAQVSINPDSDNTIYQGVDPNTLEDFEDNTLLMVSRRTLQNLMVDVHSVLGAGSRKMRVPRVSLCLRKSSQDTPLRALKKRI